MGEASISEDKFDTVEYKTILSYQVNMIDPSALSSTVSGNPGSPPHTPDTLDQGHWCYPQGQTCLAQPTG